MAEIRKTTAPLDDFNRADENPLSHGGDWSRVAPSNPTVWGLMELENHGATHDDPLTFGFMYWNRFTMNNDDCEVWGRAAGGNASGTSWSLSLLKDVGGASNIVDGYNASEFITTGGGNVRIRRYTNGGFTQIASSSTSPATGNPGLLLLRRNGTHLELWNCPNNSTTWTKYLDVVDTTYMTGLYAAIGVADNSSSQITGWSEFGAGAQSPYVPQLMLDYRTLKI